MDTAIPHLQTNSFERPIFSLEIPVLRFTTKNVRKILKAFLLSRLYEFLCEELAQKSQHYLYRMEYHVMDSKVIQHLIQGIIATEEYTLEGIAHYTHIPFDVIYDAACGTNIQISVTPWARVVDLYLKVKPEIKKELVNKLIEISDESGGEFSSLLVNT